MKMLWFKSKFCGFPQVFAFSMLLCISYWNVSHAHVGFSVDQCAVVGFEIIYSRNMQFKFEMC